jgi:hypothetical protein
VAKPTQAEKFKKAAKEAQADQDEAAFKKRLEKIVKPAKPTKK